MNSVTDSLDAAPNSANVRQSAGHVTRSTRSSYLNT